jgi:hypothetical protein
MANTRIPPFKSLGNWAENADTIIPPVPSPAVAYRDETTTQMENEDGEFYNSIPGSAKFNQKMYIITRFITEIDQHGTVGWSDQVDYIAHPPTNVLAAITWADDGVFYQAVQESGPGTGAGAQDPALDVGGVYWEKITSASAFLLDLSDQNPGTEGARLVGTTGQTVQTDLDFLNDRAKKLHKLTLVLAGSFDEDGILLGNGFNIKDNIAEKLTSKGFQYFRITLENEADLTPDLIPFVTAQREVDPEDSTNLLTAVPQVIVGPWSSEAGLGSLDVDLTNTIKIVLIDPFNTSIQHYLPFTIIGEKVSI